MNMLHVIASMNPLAGGTSEAVRSIVEPLKELGVSSEILTFDSTDDAFIQNTYFKMYALGASTTPYRYNAQLKSWLLENLGRFDVVIIHGLWLYTSFGTFNAWKTFKKNKNTAPRLFVMPHGMLDPYFQKAKERRFKALRNRLFWSIFEKRVLNGATGILFTCEQELLLARTTFSGYKPQAELNVGYGIEAPPLEKPEFRIDFEKKCPDLKGKKYWLFLSRIHEKKGVDLLINAYQKLQETHKALPALVIAGPGLESDYGKAILNLVESNSIYFPGMLSGNSKWGALYGAEVFVLPSHQENFGIAVVEAMACKTPVLISDKVNIWMEIKGGEAGIVFPDDEQAVYEALAYLQTLKPEAIQEMGANALKTYREHFTIDKVSRVFKNRIAHFTEEDL